MAAGFPLGVGVGDEFNFLWRIFHWKLSIGTSFFFTGNFSHKHFQRGFSWNFCMEKFLGAVSQGEQNVRFKFVCLALHRRLEEE